MVGITARSRFRRRHVRPVIPGKSDQRRQPRLRSIRETPPGWIRLATCNACGHRGVLPAERTEPRVAVLPAHRPAIT